MRIRAIFALLAFLVFGIVGSAKADTIIDLRTFTPPNNTTLYMNGPDKLEASSPYLYTELHCDGVDGCGVHSFIDDITFRDHDEVNNQERLRYTFGSAQTVLGLDFSDLFNECHFLGGCYLEKISFSFNGGVAQTVSALLTNLPGITNGEVSVAVFQTGVNYIDIFSMENSLFFDASLQKIRIADPVPEPASLMLLGAGLLFSVRRLRNRKGNPQVTA